MQTDLTTGLAGSITTQQASPKAGPSQDIDDFIYLISHDVRASVRALLELPQWIKEDLEEAGVRVDGPVSDSIDLMNRHTGRLDRMLVDLLAFSRVGRLQTVRPLNVAEILDDVLENTRIPVGFAITRQLDCSEIVMGDRDLPTLLGALVSNAIKHHDLKSGQISIRTWREGAHAVISVSDDGPGISEQFHERIFAPMTTLRPRDEVEGSGMGLATVRKIALEYGGDVCITDTEQGRGSVIEVRIVSDRSA